MMESRMEVYTFAFFVLKIVEEGIVLHFLIVVLYLECPNLVSFSPKYQLILGKRDVGVIMGTGHLSGLMVGALCGVLVSLWTNRTFWDSLDVFVSLVLSHVTQVKIRVMGMI